MDSCEKWQLSFKIEYNLARLRVLRKAQLHTENLVCIFY